MAEIHLHFSFERCQDLTVGQLTAIQEGRFGQKIGELREFLALFVVDGQGRFLEGDEALACIDGMKIRQMYEAFGFLLKEMNQAMVPPRNAGSSGPATLPGG